MTGGVRNFEHIGGSRCILAEANLIAKDKKILCTTDQVSLLKKYSIV